MGHYTNVTQPGKHYTWLRHPLHRDISHFNYDCEYGHQLIDDFVTHLSMIAGNFLVLWLYGKYLGRKDLVPIEIKYKIVKSALHNFEKVYNSDKFENSWKEIAKELNVAVNPRLDSNRVKKDYKQKSYSNVRWKGTPTGPLEGYYQKSRENCYSPIAWMQKLTQNAQKNGVDPPFKYVSAGTDGRKILNDPHLYN